MNKYNTVLFLFSMTALTLVIGFSLGFPAFGGHGFVQYPDITINGANYPRGSAYAFSSNEEIQVSNLSLLGQENTVIEFSDTRPDSFLIHLVTDRLFVSGATSIRTNDIILKIDGSAELIHYSWLNELEITLSSGSLVVFIDGSKISTFQSENLSESFVISTETGLATE